MTDIVDTATRSRMMAGIRSSNTRPEKLVRSLLHRQGFRFRLNVKQLPGKPDIVLPKYKAVIFVHGCFWHGHDACPLFKLPATRTDFWQQKITTNQNNDARAMAALIEQGWRVGVIWECAVRGKKRDLTAVVSTVADWLKSEQQLLHVDAKLSTTDDST